MIGIIKPDQGNVTILGYNVWKNAEIQNIIDFHEIETELRNKIFEKQIKDFKTKRTTTFLSSRIFSPIQAICHRFLIIKAGRIVAEMSTNKIKTLSDKWYEIKFITTEDLNNFLNNDRKIETVDTKTKTIKLVVLNQTINKFLKSITKFNLNRY